MKKARHKIKEESSKLSWIFA